MIYKKTQSILEYSILVATIVGGLLSVQFYLKRSMQGKIMEIGGQLAERYNYGNIELYERSVVRRHTVNWALPAPKNRITEKVNYNYFSSRELKDKIY